MSNELVVHFSRDKVYLIYDIAVSNDDVNVSKRSSFKIVYKNAHEVAVEDTTYLCYFQNF